MRDSTFVGLVTLAYVTLSIVDVLIQDPILTDTEEKLMIETMIGATRQFESEKRMSIEYYEHFKGASIFIGYLNNDFDLPKYLSSNNWIALPENKKLDKSLCRGTSRSGRLSHTNLPNEKYFIYCKNAIQLKMFIRRENDRSLFSIEMDEAEKPPSIISLYRAIRSL